MGLRSIPLISRIRLSCLRTLGHYQPLSLRCLGLWYHGIFRPIPIAASCDTSRNGHWRRLSYPRSVVQVDMVANNTQKSSLKRVADDVLEDVSGKLTPSMQDTATTRKTRAKYEAQRRAEVAEQRKRGVCSRCRLSKAPVSFTLHDRLSCFEHADVQRCSAPQNFHAALVTVVT